MYRVDRGEDQTQRAGQGGHPQGEAIEATIPGAVSPNKAFAKVQLQKALRTLDRLQRGTANASLKPEGGGGSGAVTRDEATRYLQRAGGNRDKARELARAEGRSF